MGERVCGCGKVTGTAVLISSRLRTHTRVQIAARRLWQRDLFSSPPEASRSQQAEAGSRYPTKSSPLRPHACRTFVFCCCGAHSSADFPS